MGPKVYEKNGMSTWLWAERRNVPVEGEEQRTRWLVLKESDWLLCQTDTRRPFLWKQTFKSKEKPKYFDKVALQNQGGCQAQLVRAWPGKAACWWGAGMSRCGCEADPTSLSGIVGLPAQGYKVLTC